MLSYVLQTVKIVREAEQQGLATLREQASSGSSAREFTFGHREDGFNQGATGVFLTREMVSHLGADAVNAPGLLPAFGGDDTQGMKLPTDKGVIALGIELGVGQHAAHRSVGMGLRDEFGEMSTVIPRGLPCRLRQDELPLQVDDGQPFQPMAPRQRLLGVVIHAAYEKGADRAFGQPGGIDGDRGTASWTGHLHAPNHFVQESSDRGLVQSAQEAVKGGVVRNGAKPESVAQFRMFGHAHFGFPIGPVLVAHEAQDGQQLRLRELVFAKAAAR